MDEPEKIPIAGKVVWVTPRRAQGNRTAGIGVRSVSRTPTPTRKSKTTWQAPDFQIGLPHDVVGEPFLMAARDMSCNMLNLIN